MLRSTRSLTRAVRPGMVAGLSSQIPAPKWSVHDLNLFPCGTADGGGVSPSDIDRLASLAAIRIDDVGVRREMIADDINIILRCARKMKADMEAAQFRERVFDHTHPYSCSLRTATLRDDFCDKETNAIGHPYGNSIVVDGHFVSAKK